MRVYAVSWYLGDDLGNSIKMWEQSLHHWVGIQGHISILLDEEIEAETTILYFPILDGVWCLLSIQITE